MHSPFYFWEGRSKEVETMEFLSFILVLLLAGVHLSVRFYTKLIERPRKSLLSFAGGASVGYITVHLLPEFQKVQSEFNHILHIPKHLEEYSLYVLATIGFLTFYSINHLVKKSEQKNSIASLSVFTAHIGAFVLYNSFIGYYLIKGLEQEPKSLFFFTAVFVLHIMVNDVALRLDHKNLYDPWGSGVLALSIFIGWLIGFFTTLPTVVFATWFAWLAGGILLNTIKEELPKERKSKFIPFLLGSVISTILFLFI